MCTFVPSRGAPSLNERLTEHAYHQKMGAERRQDKLRVRFSQPVSVWIMGIDGTWRRSCSMEDISDTGAKLTVEGALDGLHLKELFLLLSSTGLAYRSLRTGVAPRRTDRGFVFAGGKPKRANHS